MMNACWTVQCILLFEIYCFTVLCPFTKVEESFNAQAMHDLLHFGLNPSQLSKYDHLAFPGVVPRTFLGPLVISFFVKLLHLPSTLLACRLVLGTVVWLCFVFFCRSVKLRYGERVLFWTTVSLITQFHFSFYASRPLPNTFAMCIVLLALAEWLHPNPTLSRHKCVLLLGFTIAVFRCDVLVLTAFIGLQIILGHSLFAITLYGLCGLVGIAVGAILSYSVDSHFWQRNVWPEAEVFYFNVIDNKSSDYGVSPFYWYVLIALPKMMLASYLFFIVSLVQFRHFLTQHAWPLICFVFAYSILPHKEVRFIFYVLPVFSLGSGLFLSKIFAKADTKRDDGKVSSKLFLLLKFGIIIGLLLSFVVSVGFAVLSSYNYPGGYALKRLHKDYSQGKVFIDTMTSMEGITRFGEQEGWQYVKEEPVGEFDYYIIGDREDTKGIDLNEKQLLFTIDGFQLRKLKFAPRVWVYGNIGRIE